MKSFVNVSVTQKNPSVSLRLPAPFSREPLFPPTKLPRRGEQAAAAAVTLPFSHLKLGGKVSGDSPPQPPPHANPLKNYYFRRGALHHLQK